MSRIEGITVEAVGRPKCTCSCGCQSTELSINGKCSWCNSNYCRKY